MPERLRPSLPVPDLGTPADTRTESGKSSGYEKSRNLSRYNISGVDIEVEVTKRLPLNGVLDEHSYLHIITSHPNFTIRQEVYGGDGAEPGDPQEILMFRASGSETTYMLTRRRDGSIAYELQKDLVSSTMKPNDFFSKMAETVKGPHQMSRYVDTLKMSMEALSNRSMGGPPRGTLFAGSTNTSPASSPTIHIQTDGKCATVRDALEDNGTVFRSGVAVASKPLRPMSAQEGINHLGTAGQFAELGSLQSSLPPQVMQALRAATNPAWVQEVTGTPANPHPVCRQHTDTKGKPSPRLP